MLTRRGACAALALLVTMAAVAPAGAHGPTRQKVVETVEINLPPDKVWAAIGNFQDMGWHPAVAKTEGTGGNDVGATRTLTLQSGGKINEKLTKYEAGRSLSYEITDVDPKVVPVANYAATLSVKDAGGKSQVEWKSSFYRSFLNNDPPPEESDEAAFKAIEGIFKSGLEAMKKKLEGG